MKTDKLIQKARKMAAGCRIVHGKRFELKNFPPDDTGNFEREDKPEFQNFLRESIATMALFQEKLYAAGKNGILIILQGMDGAGKDSAIRHVMSGINPEGCRVVGFKVPTEKELKHDYMWRCILPMPERGEIVLYNRSYYEELLVTKVHPGVLAKQNLPESLTADPKALFQMRYDHIRALEKFWVRNGFAVCKFFLNLSEGEQKKRFLDRLNDPTKNWKVSPNDYKERPFWNAYMKAYEKMIVNTASAEAPWYVIPSDRKWYAHGIISAVLLTLFDQIDPQFPTVDPAVKKQFDTYRKELNT